MSLKLTCFAGGKWQNNVSWLVHGLDNFPISWLFDFLFKNKIWFGFLCNSYTYIASKVFSFKNYFSQFFHSDHFSMPNKMIILAEVLQLRNKWLYYYLKKKKTKWLYCLKNKVWQCFGPCNYFFSFSLFLSLLMLLLMLSSKHFCRPTS